MITTEDIERRRREEIAAEIKQEQVNQESRRSIVSQFEQATAEQLRRNREREAKERAAIARVRQAEATFDVTLKAKQQAQTDYDDCKAKARVAAGASLPPCSQDAVDGWVKACRSATDARHKLAASERRESEALAELGQARRELERL